MNAPSLTVVAYRRELHEPAYLRFIAKVMGAEECEHRRQVLASMHERMPGRDRLPLRHVILDGDRVAGSLGYLPADFWIKGERVAVRFTHDLLVDPDYRGQGLAKLVVDNARAQGDFFPGGMWMTDPCYKIHLACGFDDVAAITTHTLALSVSSFVAQKKLSPAKGLVALTGLSFTCARSLGRAHRVLKRARGAIKSVDRFDAALDSTWARLGASYSITLARDAAYLNWRYADHPHLGYKFAVASRNGHATGFVVWRPSSVGEKRAVVTDFLVEKGDVATFERLVSHVMVESCRARCDSLSVITTQEWATRTLRSFGFFPRGARSTWVIAGWQNRIPKEWLTDHEPWHVVLGDSDGDIWSHAR